MQNLLAFLLRNYHWLLFLLLETVSVVLLFRYNSYQGSVWVSSANSVAGVVYEASAQVEHYFHLGEVNEQLTARNVSLEQQLAHIRRSDTIAPQARGIAAKVVSNSIDRPDNLITIDKGRADGVRPDMGVAGGTGLVGVVFIAGDHYSVVIPLLNTRSHISCSIRKSNYFGYLQWTGGDPSVAYIEDIPRHARFRRGDWVETSGYSSIFPAGITVGRIEQVYNSSDGLSYRLKVRLATDFSCLRDVVVIEDQGALERMRLEEAARDSLSGSKYSHSS